MRVSGRATALIRSAPADLEVGVVLPGARPVWKLVSGHLPAPSVPGQVLASFTLQQDDGVHLGTVIHVPFYTPSQLPAVTAVNNATGAPPRPMTPAVAFRVVGIEAAEGEFPSGSSPVYDLFATRAFARTVIPRTAVSYEYFVRLRRGAAGLPRFDAASSALSTAGVVGYQNANQELASVEASIHPQAIGWWILAGLAAVVGMAVIGQALGRQSVIESEDYPTLVALGADRRQIVTLGMARNLAVALAGAAGAVALATALSPLAPVGEARIAETSTGVAFDTLILLPGALALVVAVLAAGAWPALGAGRTVRSGRSAGQAEVSRPSAMVARLAAMGAPPSALIGIRQALQRRYGGNTVPVGTALLGTVLAVAALCGTGVFGASLSHLTATPTLYGDPFQLNFSDLGSHGDPALLRSLVQDRAITRISHGIETESSVNKMIVGGIAATDLGTGALFTTAGYEDAACPPGPRQVACRQAVERSGNRGLLPSVVPGPRGQAAITHYVDTDPTITTLPTTPASLINFGEAVNFPLIFGAMLAVFGAATLAHLLVVSVSRRRREIGLLKVLGFVTRQVASTVAWQATTVALVGIVIGVPVGIAAGQALWRAFATNLGVVPVSVVPPWLVAGLVAGIIVVANLLAIGPGLAATRSKPAQLLRTR